jgi:hypothetical protein
MLRHRERAKLRRGVKRLEHIAHETSNLLTVYNPEALPDHDHSPTRIAQAKQMWGETTDTGASWRIGVSGQHPADDERFSRLV